MYYIVLSSGRRQQHIGDLPQHCAEGAWAASGDDIDARQWLPRGIKCHVGKTIIWRKHLGLTDGAAVQSNSLDGCIGGCKCASSCDVAQANPANVCDSDDLCACCWVLDRHLVPRWVAGSSHIGPARKAEGHLRPHGASVGPKELEVNAICFAVACGARHLSQLALVPISKLMLQFGLGLGELTAVVTAGSVEHVCQDLSRPVTIQDNGEQLMVH